MNFRFLKTYFWMVRCVHKAGLNPLLETGAQICPFSKPPSGETPNCSLVSPHKGSPPASWRSTFVSTSESTSALQLLSPLNVLVCDRWSSSKIALISTSMQARHVNFVATGCPSRSESRTTPCPPRPRVWPENRRPMAPKSSLRSVWGSMSASVPGCLSETSRRLRSLGVAFDATSRGFVVYRCKMCKLKSQ